MAENLKKLEDCFDKTKDIVRKVLYVKIREDARQEIEQKNRIEGAEGDTGPVSDFELPSTVPESESKITDRQIHKFINELTELDPRIHVSRLGEEEEGLLSYQQHLRLIITLIYNYANGATVPGIFLSHGRRVTIPKGTTGAQFYATQRIQKCVKDFGLSPDAIKELRTDAIAAAGLAPLDEPAEPHNVDTCAQKEQKFLINNIDILSKRNRDRATDPLMGYEQFISVEGSTQEIVTSLKGTNTKEALFRITPAQQALLVPKVRIFKVVTPDPIGDPSRQIEKELVFRNYVPEEDIDRITAGDAGRPGSVGIQSISIDSTGESVGQIRGPSSKLFRVNLKLFFNDLGALFPPEVIREAEESLVGANPVDPAYRDAHFLDLIWKTEDTVFSPTTGKIAPNPEDFQIRLVLGWAVPDDKDGLFSQDLLTAIRDTITHFYLTKTLHELAFKDDGSITLSITYEARPTNNLESRKMDILQSLSYKRESLKIELELEGLRQTLEKEGGNLSPAKKGEIKKKKDALEKRKKNLLANTRKERLRSLINNIVKQEGLKAVDVKNKVFDSIGRLKNYTSAAAVDSLSDAQKQEWANVATAEDAVAKLGVFNDLLFRMAPGTPENHNRIHFFYFGDLLEAIIETVKQGNPLADNTEFMLVPFLYKNPEMSPDSIQVPLEDIPISVAFFNDWMVENIIAKQAASFSMHQFLVSFMKDVVTRSLNFLSLNNSTMEARFYKTQFAIGYQSIPKIRGKAPLQSSTGIQAGGAVVKQRVLKVEDIRSVLWDHTLDLDRNLGIDGSTDYIIIYPDRPVEKSTLRGNYVEDFKNGIYHLLIGQDSGLVKTITFQRMKIPFREERLFARVPHGYNQFYRAYNAEVTMVGSPWLHIHSRIYINPTYTTSMKGPSDPGSVFKKFGLGGYYNVMKVNHTLNASGQLVTKATCVFVDAGDSNPKKSLSEIGGL
jgi:hypothetical protein